MLFFIAFPASTAIDSQTLDGLIMFYKMRIPAERTFESFVLKFGGELVSRLISNVNPSTNADYLFRLPDIVAELKCVERDAFTTDDRDKLNALALDWMRRGLIPPIFGRGRIHLRNLPPECQLEWVDLHKGPWKRKLDKANKQIKNTKALLKVPNACGILFLLDDATHSFLPKEAINFIAGVLRSKKPDGTQIYSHLDWIVYLSVNPKTVTPDGVGLNFWIPAYRHNADEGISAFLESFKHGWTRYLGDFLKMKSFEIPGEHSSIEGNWVPGLNRLRVED